MDAQREASRGGVGQSSQHRRLHRCFENSVVRCLQEKVNGETRILRQFKLLTEKAEGKEGSQVRKPIQLQQTSEPGLQYDQPAQIASEKPTASGNIFTCVS